MAKIQTCSTEHADRPMDLKTKIRRYESWIDDQLKEDLRKIETSFRKVNDEITELSQLKNTVNFGVPTDSNFVFFNTTIKNFCNFVS